MSEPAETPPELAHLVEVDHSLGRDRRDADFWAWQRVAEIA